MQRALTAILAVLAFGSTLSASADAARRDSLSRLLDRTVAAHPNALWHIVHELCVPDMRASGNPTPCASVNLAGGYAVINDVQSPYQVLLLPTARVTGIESPALLEKTSPNYWQAAWSARKLLERRVGRPVPREEIGLAVNSVPGRTQNQLHIHVSCIQPYVLKILVRYGSVISSRHWSYLHVGHHGHPYRVRWFPGDELGARDPFKILARADPKARADMGQETLVILGASRPNGQPGFVMLSDNVDAASHDLAAGEELLDHECRVLSAPLGGNIHTPISN